MIKIYPSFKEKEFVDQLPNKEDINIDNYNDEVIRLAIECKCSKLDYDPDVTDGYKLIDVFFNTRELSKTKYRDETDRLINDTKVYSNLSPLANNDNPSDVAMLIGGTLEVSNILSKYYKVAALNFADGKKPGGWPEDGCLTQEENICRCSNMYEAIISDKCIKEYYQVNMDNDNHGLCTDTVIYLPNVTVFKDDRDYHELESTFKYDIITCPAPSCRFRDNDEALMVYKRRIEQIVLSAIKNNVECLVLGAWGCGAFGQDKKLIAQAFVDVLNKYSGYFKLIVFAMKNTPKWNQDRPYDVFYDAIDEKYKGVFYVEEINNLLALRNFI